MAIAINGSSNTITGLAVGGLPDGIVDSDMLAANAVATAKIADDAVTDAKQNLSGIAKAWCNFSGGVSGFSTFGERDSFGISSIAETGTGRYTVSFTTSMANTNYCVVSSGHYLATVSGNVREVGATALATGSYVLEVSYNGTTLQDATNVFSAVFGG